MKHRVKRFCALVLCLTFLCPMLLTLGAVRADAANEKQFIFASLVAKDGTSFTAGEELDLPLTSDNVVFKAQEIQAMGENGSTNAIYVSLVNNSNATGVRITYQYSINSPAQKSVEQLLTPNSKEEQSFVLHTPNLSNHLTDLSIEFLGEGELKGTVTLYSLFDVSVYNDSFLPEGYAAEATVEVCRHDAEKGTIEISGDLSWEATVNYSNGTLALFALEPDEEYYLSKKTPVARMGVSFSFSFSVPVKSAEDVYARYLLAAIVTSTDDQTGETMIEHIPLCSPFYPDVKASDTKMETGFKGFHTDSFFSVIDSGADVEIVDVYLDRLQSPRNSGILYAGAHSYYYFDESYINELDQSIRNLTGAGCDVYLRFLISPDANGLPFVTYTESSAGIINKGIVVDNEEALLSIHAFTDFLTMRYAGGNEGRVNGIILGRRADQAATYGYVGNMGLEKYAELYATTLNLVAGTARGNIPSINVVVPLSDRMWPHTVTESNLTGDYFTELFLLSLLEALRSRVLTPPAFSVMLESVAIPDRLVEEESACFYGADRVQSFLSILEQYHSYYNFIDTSVLYAWQPDASCSAETLRAAYVLQYIMLLRNGRVDGFFVDLSLLEGEGYRFVKNALQHLVTHIDTDSSAEVLAPILESLRVDSLAQIFPNFNASSLKHHSIIRLPLQENAYQSGAQPIGSYDLWSFTTTTDTLGWYAGYACTDVSVLGNALNATFKSTGGEEYAELAYHYSSIKNFSFAPLMRLRVTLDGESAVPFEVQVRLLGESTTVISSVVMLGGSTNDLFLDFSGALSGINALRGIRIMARPLESTTAEYNLKLHTLTLESTTLNSEQLADRIAAAQNDGADAGEQEASKDYTTPILVTVIIIAASLALVASLILRHRHHARIFANGKAPRAEDSTEGKHEKKKDG